MSIINENRVRRRSKPISWPSCALVSLGFLPFEAAARAAISERESLVPLLFELLKTGVFPFPF